MRLLSLFILFVSLSGLSLPLREIPSAPPVPQVTLQTVVGDAQTDAQAYHRIEADYSTHADELAQAWGLSGDALKAAYIMNLLHISHPYNVVEPSDSFVEYVHQPASMSRYFADAQAWLSVAFGLDCRRFDMTLRDHSWIENRIDGRWQTFDATINVWFDRSLLDMMAGESRTFRRFPSPVNAGGAVWLAHREHGFDVIAFRERVIRLGVRTQFYGQAIESECT